MVMWGLAVGALLGWILSDFEAWGAIVGAFLGMGALQWLRVEMRSEIRALIEDERDTLFEVVKLRVAEAVASARPQPVQAVPVAPARAERVRAWADPAPTAVAAVPEAPAGEREEMRTPEPEHWEEPETLSPASSVMEAVRGWVFGGNTIVRVGLIILFVGLSFLARYAAMAGLFPIEFRLALVAAAGIALLVTGFLRRHARPDFALALQGAGVAVIYLTIFGAARFFELLPLLPAFILMLLVCALGCALALLQNSRLLALAAFVGGFAVPLLLGGEGSSVGLFGYYAVLNLAVLALVWRKGWRALGLIAFFATFGVMGAWVATSYTPAEYTTTQAFLILFMLVHVALAVLMARSRPGLGGVVVDSSLLFGPALAGLGIQIALVRHLELGDAFSALGFAAFYLAVGALLRKRGGAAHAILFDAMLAIGVGALTLAVPLALGASWTSSVWAIEGAVAVWIGRRQSRWLPRFFGLALMAVATLFFLSSIGTNVSAIALVGRNTLGAAIVAASLLFAAWLLRAAVDREESALGSLHWEMERLLPVPLFLAGFLMWCLGIGLEASRRLPSQLAGELPMPAIPAGVQGLVILLGMFLSAGAARWVGRRFDWPVATWPSHMTLPVLAAVFAVRLLDGHFILHSPDWMFWLAALAMHVFYLYRNDRVGSSHIGEAVQRMLHIGGVWLLMGMLANCLWFGIDQGQLWGSGWAAVSFLTSGIAALAVLTIWAGRANHADAVGSFRWPLNPHADGYWWQAAVPVAGLVWLGALAVAFTSSGKADPLPYLPLLNPVDLSLALALGGLLLWQRCIARAEPTPQLAVVLAGREGKLSLALLAFLIVNSMWLRLAHHYLGVPWSASSMMADSSVQAGLAILWTLLALGLMLLAHRRAQRQLWLAGATLLGAVVLKLLLVDLSSAAGGQRIIAFIGVGVLMLVVGYFVPLPPKADDGEMAE